MGRWNGTSQQRLAEDWYHSGVTCTDPLGYTQTGTETWFLSVLLLLFLLFLSPWKQVSDAAPNPIQTADKDQEPGPGVTSIRVSRT